VVMVVVVLFSLLPHESILPNSSKQSYSCA
jgi:hypothetical protein